MGHGSNDFIEDDYDESGSMSEDSREDKTAYPCKRPRRSSVKIDEDPERTLAYEVTRHSSIVDSRSLARDGSLIT